MKNLKNIVKNKRILLVIGCILLISIPLLLQLSTPSKKAEVKLDKKPKEPIFHEPADLISPMYMVVDLESGKTLYEKDSTKIMYPASLTKIMTTLIGIEEYKDVNKKLTVTPDDVANIEEQEASIAGFIIKEKITVKDALYGLILPSGADAANVLANHMKGGKKQFIKEMNALAKDLGMKETTFINTTGLHDKRQKTTLQDLQKLMVYAWKKPLFKEIFTSDTYRTTGNAIHENGITFKSTRLLFGDTTLQNGSFIGSKTGYTPEAGNCMISVAEIDGHPYMVISAKAKGIPKDKHHIEDAKKIYNQIALDRKQK